MAKPKESPKLKLGEVIKSYRQKNDIGQREFAKHIKMHPSTLCRIEDGLNPDVANLMKILNWMLA